MSAHQVPDILRRIVARRRERIGDSSRAAKPSRRSEPLTAAENPFLAALEAHRGRAVIAEIKLGSPRLGSIAERVDWRRQSEIYRAHGAAALSVVVEPDHFFGSYELLAEARRTADLPTLAKDFIVDSSQLFAARRAGADAVLLIAALHEGDEMRRYAEEARALGLVPLIECASGADVVKLAGSDWELVGVNNRDLRTFDVSLERSIALLPELPGSALKVTESGIANGADRRRLTAAGFDAFLVGEALLLSEDPAALLAGLIDGA